MKISRQAAVALGVAVGGLALAGPASAHHSTNPNTKDLAHVETSHEVACGTASVTLTVPDGTPQWNYRLQVEVNGAIFGSTDLVSGPGSSTLDVPFAEDEGGGSVTVRYYFLDAEEWDIVDAEMNYKATYPDVGEGFKSFEVATDCATEPPATDPPATDPPATAEPCVDVNTATADELLQLKNIDVDRAQQILDLRPFSSVDDLGRVNGLKVGGPELAGVVAGGDGYLPLCELGDGDEAPAPGAGGELPTTGVPVPLFAGGGAVLVGLGAGVLLLVRRRKTAFTA
jgi:LPXTG-motif cell wall-anchored protein